MRSKTYIWLPVASMLLMACVSTETTSPPDQVQTDSPSATGTAAPTLVPTAASTVTPSQDSRAETVAYFAWAQSTFPSISSNLTELGTLFSNPLPENDAWREEIGQRAKFLITTRNDALVVVPTEKMKDPHDLLMAALEVYAEAGGLVLTWLDTGDNSILILSAAKIEEGGKLITLATVQIKDAAK